MDTNPNTNPNYNYNKIPAGIWGLFHQSDLGLGLAKST